MPVDEALSHWLQVREPADVAARSSGLTSDVARALPAGEPCSILDLGTGTGSNVRYLATRLAGAQRWLAVDRNAELLAELPDRMASWAASSGYETHVSGERFIVRGDHFECEIRTKVRDLGSLDDHEIFAGRHVVTASALLDLVSEPWLRALAAHCHTERAVSLFGITYNGRFGCTPEETGDEMARHLMNRHQRTDKGLGGPAAGPDAATAAEQAFVSAGYRVRREASDWRIEPAQREIQRLLVDGWAEAAAEMAPDRASVIERWRARRHAHIEAGTSRITVGHDDLAAWPDAGQAVR